MSALVFVDTNIFLYAAGAPPSRKQLIASQWIEHLWKEQIGRTGIQVLNEIYATLTRKVQPPLAANEAWDRISALFAWEPLPLDTEVLIRAREIGLRHTLSWWDTLIVAAAQLQGCALLLTEDLHDRAVYGGVTIHNPFVAGASEAATIHESAPAAVSRHRSRGRPKRANYSPG
jgi:predicted nucleic acid-binding protein